MLGCWSDGIGALSWFSKIITKIKCGVEAIKVCCKSSSGVSPLDYYGEILINLIQHSNTPTLQHSSVVLDNRESYLLQTAEFRTLFTKCCQKKKGYFRWRVGELEC